MPVCGLSANITGLRDIVSKVNTIVALSALVGLPTGRVALQGVVDGLTASIKIQINKLLPELPFADELTNLRDTLGDFANGIETDINGLIGDFGDIVNLDGLANTDLANLVQSAISTAQNFDPCSLASGIPNVVKDASGNLFSLPEPAFIGQTDYGSVFGDVLETYDYIDDAVEGVKGNITDINSLIGDAKGAINTMTTLTDLTNIRNALESNVTGSMSSMGQSLKKTISGDTVLQSIDEYRQELISFRKHLVEG